MPLLGALLINLFGGLAAYLAQFFTQKVAVATAISLLLGSLLVGVYVTLRAALAAVTGAAANIHPMFGAGVQMIVGATGPGLLTSYIALWVGMELYKWKLTIVQLWARTI